jgi:hypothetical protein
VGPVTAGRANLGTRPGWRVRDKRVGAVSPALRWSAFSRRLMGLFSSRERPTTVTYDRGAGELVLRFHGFRQRFQTVANPVL